MNGYSGTATTFLVKFASTKAGLSTIGYQLKDATGANVGSRVSTGIVDMGHGYYQTLITFATATAGSIMWDTGDAVPSYASEEVNVVVPWIVSTGTGSIPTTIIVEVDNNFLDNVAIYVTSDIYGNNVVAGTLYTDTFGEANFLLDAGTYYVWKQIAGYNFTNPEIITVS